MRAVDTDVVIRYLVNDDPSRFSLASALINNNPLLLSLTVALEVECVLRKAYRYARADIVHAFGVLLRESMMMVEDPAVLAQAMIWFESGLDFADALHLASAMSARCAGFATFDSALIKSAARPGAGHVAAPWARACAEDL
jgi:predicted nucleic-acid-binding protein